MPKDSYQSGLPDPHERTPTPAKVIADGLLNWLSAITRATGLLGEHIAGVELLGAHVGDHGRDKSTSPRNDNGSGSSRLPTSARTPFRRANATAIGSTSVANTVARRWAEPRTAATAPLQAHETDRAPLGWAELEGAPANPGAPSEVQFARLQGRRGGC